MYNTLHNTVKRIVVNETCILIKSLLIFFADGRIAIKLVSLNNKPTFFVITKKGRILVYMLSHMVVLILTVHVSVNKGPLKTY